MLYYDRLCHIRELAIVQMEEPEIKQLMPEIYYSISSISKVSYIVLLLLSLTSCCCCCCVGYVCICNGVSF